MKEIHYAGMGFNVGSMSRLIDVFLKLVARQSFTGWCDICVYVKPIGKSFIRDNKTEMNVVHI